MEVAVCERGYVVSPSPELTSFVGIGEELRITLRVPESPAKLCVVVWDEVFRVLVWVGGGEGGCLGPFFTHPCGGGACWGLWLRRGGARLGKAGCRGCHTM